MTTLHWSPSGRPLAIGLAALTATLLLASAAGAEVVYLKNGNKIETREPYEVEGDQAVLTLTNGAVSKIPLEDIDVERTAAANRPGFGSAQVIEGTETRPIEQALPPPERRQTRTLSQVAAERTLQQRGDSQPLEPAANAVEHAPRTPLADGTIRSFLTSLYSSQNFSPELFENNGPGTATVRLTTDSEAEVFRGLVTTALALLESTEQLDQGLAVLELEMRSSDGGQAGDFRITHDRAQALRQKHITPEDFYIRYVEF